MEIRVQQILDEVEHAINLEYYLKIQIPQIRIGWGSIWGLGVPLTVATTALTNGISAITTDPIAPIVSGIWIFALGYAYSGYRFGIKRAKVKKRLPNTQKRLDHLEKWIQQLKTVDYHLLTGKQRRQYRAIVRTANKVREIYSSELQGSLKRKQMVKLAAQGVTDKEQMEQIKKTASLMKKEAGIKTQERALVAESRREGGAIKEFDQLPETWSKRWIRRQRDKLEQQKSHQADYKKFSKLIEERTAAFRKESERGQTVLGGVFS